MPATATIVGAVLGLWARKMYSELPLRKLPLHEASVGACSGDGFWERSSSTNSSNGMNRSKRISIRCSTRPEPRQRAALLQRLMAVPWARSKASSRTRSAAQRRFLGHEQVRYSFGTKQGRAWQRARPHLGRFIGHEQGRALASSGHKARRVPLARARRAPLHEQGILARLTKLDWASTKSKYYGLIS
ncbi:hypothetical protein Scep_027625 [Stephania cephalantha]|uniref:Uncharacterized protein n=1 Tax=Stephania cephalantha TaxID=152367 RepID=A0AAP0HHE6_9MAGN